MIFVFLISKLFMPLSEKLALLTAYQKLYQAHGHTALSLRYVLKCRVRLLVLRGKVVAGYTINAGHAAFRYLPKQRAAALAAWGLNMNECMEITAIVFAKTLPRSHRTALLVLSLLDALTCRRRAIVGGSTVPAVQQNQMRVLRHVLLDEDIVFTREDGTQETRRAKVYFAYREEVIPRLMKCLVEDALKSFQVKPKLIWSK
jgi:hypothetical protein